MIHQLKKVYMRYGCIFLSLTVQDQRQVKERMRLKPVTGYLKIQRSSYAIRPVNIEINIDKTTATTTATILLT